MGEPTRGNARVPYTEHIGIWGERGELKHLSTLRKRDYSLSSGERKGRSLNRPRVSVKALRGLGCKRRREELHLLDKVRNQLVRKKALERPTKEGDSPVFENELTLAGKLEYHGAR